VSELEARELIKTHISHLRYKLEPDPASPIHILTLRGKGYLWAPD
jgi:DNA-binding response OmpR family regulator